jgi:uncharacterized protein (TIGR00288 family)
MSSAFSRAPHTEGTPHNPAAVAVHAPNAGLLIDFDNVTMGMRSDLSKELKNLLRSDIIRGKVTVQRAYADWRRYPQYIVPLSEASIDLIFAPAYGSSKKNATDIRMAIDGMELVFTRPEIGTYILLTGDSDFSSLVLKLKEYGKYVIGVGIQESSSDILVQNCDEYYSYTALTGLRKTGDDSRSALDPWVLVEKAVEQMVKRKDVMRSDRLKQVMLEIDGGFDEKSYGFSKFSRFLTEAAQKGLIQLRKLENGQYEILSGSDGASPSSRDGSRDTRGRDSGGRSRESRSRSDRPDDRRGGRSRSEPAQVQPADAPSAEDSVASGAVGETGAAPEGRKDLQPAYDLMIEALKDLLEDQDSDTVRDSDVKRRMLALQESFDESTMGFSKFSLFLRQAHDHEVIDLRKTDSGNYEVAIPAGGPRAKAPKADASKAEVSKAEVGKAGAPKGEVKSRRDEKPDATSRAPVGTSPEADAPKTAETVTQDPARRLRPRLSSRRRSGKDEPPPLLEGQALGAASPSTRGQEPKAATAKDTPAKRTPAKKTEDAETRTEKPAGSRASGKKSPAPRGRAGTSEAEPKPTAGGAPVDVEALRLPTDPDAVVQYLTNSYKGVGKKTAETLVEALGESLFPTLQQDPDRVRSLLPPARAEKVLEGWSADHARRSGGPSEASGTSAAGTEPSEEDAKAASGGRRRGGRRTRGGGRGSR